MTAASLCPGSGDTEGSDSEDWTEDWKLEEGVRGVDDWVVNLWTARGALKVRIMDASKGLAFEAVFDSDALESAGMDTRLRFEDNAHTVRSALKGEGFAKASSVLLDGSDAVLSISEEMGHRTFEYRLKLLCVPLTEIDTLRMQLAKKHSAEMEKRAADFRATIEEMRQKMDTDTAPQSDVICGSDACEQRLAKNQKRITELSQKIALLETATVKPRSSDGTLDFDIALEHLKAAMAAVSHSTEETMAVCRSLEQRLVKDKTHVSAEHRSAADLCPEILPGIRSRGDAPIKKVGFCFDPYIKSGKETFHVSMDGKTVITNVKATQILVKPKVRSDCEIAFVLESFGGFIAVGVKDSGKSLTYGCRFDIRGHVNVQNTLVAKYQAFGKWRCGDRLVLTANVSSGTISIRTPNGVFSTKWMPYRSSPFWFVVECGRIGDRVRID